MFKSKYYTELSAAKKTELLQKCADLYAEKSSRVQVRIGDGGRIYKGNEVSALTIDPNASTDTIIIDTGSSEGGFGTKALVAIQDLTYTADISGTDEDAVTIQYLQRIAAVKATRIIQDLTFTADAFGTGGNAISLTYVADGTAGSETVGVVGNAITVHMESGVSTATQIKAAVDASGPAAALVDTTISGTGSNAQTGPTGPSLLTGGVNSSGLAGSEVVAVTGNAITVRLESGVSTATQVKAAVDAFPAAAALVDVSITGTAGTGQTAPVSATHLAGANNLRNFDKADILFIKRLRTKKYRIVLKASSDPAAA